ncbi:PDZ domain-containing protein [Paenibacillus sp. N4]|uniref:SepM family pheromone-processing serine protease n=1 Tax=Paenibacillus vietnamensis TaxID=2590547 RepID=UPI001CD10C68|nr:SepM family pheromone-processing serine protease [Paenibacillus vietnamensis]MCA0756644.1 PDZ domain-containing protein [Paenibacillus vietnamensis]
MIRWTSNRSKKRLLTLLVFVVFLGAVTLIPLPYYIYQPGTVENLDSYVKVENGHRSGQGSFNLTTIYSIEVNNVLTLLYGLSDKDSELRRAEQVRGTLSDGQYASLLEHMMQTSQNNAIAAALEENGTPVPLAYTGVFVQSLYPDSKAADVVFPGDVIVETDGRPVTQLSEISDMIRGKKAGDELELVVIRGGERVPVTAQLYEGTSAAASEASGSSPRVGLVTENQYEIKPPVNIEYSASDVGGPSAGLMFSLEILDQLKEGDLTRGKLIAGTGTISAEGRVGQIGGIRDKVIAAARAGVEIFFCPADVLATDRNEKDIMDEARKRGYEIAIVPVSTLSDAVHYLEGLEG